MNRFGSKPSGPDSEDFSIQRMVVGPIGTNVYILINKKTQEALVVDPGDEAQRIIARLDADKVKPVAILLTHGHFDHIEAVDEVRTHYGIPAYCLDREVALMEDPRANGSRGWDKGLSVTPDRTFRAEEEATLAGLHFRVLHTPGHTAGSCCYYFPDQKLLISGDTLFCGSYGRTDLETGNDSEIVRSVQRLLRELPEDTVVCPGHMNTTWIAFERRYNPLSEG